MTNSAIFCVVLAIIDASIGFPVDLSTVGSGQLNSVWLASSPVFAVVFLFIVIFAVFGCVCCRPGKGFEEFRNSNGALSGTVDNGFVNPRAGAELTIFPPAGATPAGSLVGNAVPVRLEQIQDGRQQPLRPASFSSSERPLSSQDWFYEPYLNFPRGQLQYVQDFGRGWFGRVVEGEATMIDKVEPRTKVIVKILHEDATLTDQMFFLHEVKPHRDLTHPNILRLLGRCLETEPFLLLLENCPNGDLKTFLTQNTGSAKALTEQGVTLRMARDICSGLDFMHQHKFIHTDLAARNCLVTPDLTIKIGDYGNAIELFREDYYIAGSVALPVRWCAPETLRCTDLLIETKEVTSFANVWTLAVVLWEICEFGRLPYDELTDDQVISRVLGEKNYMLGCPNLFCLYKDELYHLMKLCWNPPLQRPTCAQIKVILENLVSSGNRTDSESNPVDFDQRWQALKSNSIPKTDNADVLPKAHGARVADSHPEAPKEAFLTNSKAEIDSPRFRLKKSDSTQNLSGSLERLNELNKGVSDIGTSDRGEVFSSERGELDSWLQGVEVNNEDDETFVRNISEAIRDLDEALAMEKTSSSEETSGKSSKENSPGRSLKKAEDETGRGLTVDFKLGGDTSSFMSIPPKSFELSSLQNTIEPQSLTFTSLIFESKADPLFGTSLSDTEEELWKTRIERGEFTEKVKEKSKSIADLMVLTHIDPSDDSDSDKERNSMIWRTSQRASLSSNNFGSDSDIRHAVLKEGFEEDLKKLSNEHKEFGRFDSLNMIVTDQTRRESVMKTLESNPVTDPTRLESVMKSLEANPVTDLARVETVMKSLETNPVTDSTKLESVMKTLESNPVTDKTRLESVMKTLESDPVTDPTKLESVVKTLESNRVTDLSKLESVMKTLESTPVTDQTRIESVMKTLEPDPVTDLTSVETVMKTLESDPVTDLTRVETVMKTLEANPVTELTSVESVMKTLEWNPVTDSTKLESVTKTLESNPVTVPTKLESVMTIVESNPVTELTRVDPVMKTLEPHPVTEEANQEFVMKTLESNPVTDQTRQETVVETLESNPVIDVTRVESVMTLEPNPVPDVTRRDSVTKTLELNPIDDDIFLGDKASEKCAISGAKEEEEDSSSQIGPTICVETAVDEDVVEDTSPPVVFHYAKKPLKFVLKDENESSVTLGPFDDHTLNHYQGIRSTFGNANIIDNWNDHLENALQQQFEHKNFDSITFQSLDSKNVEQESPIINEITNLSDSHIWSEEETDGKLRTPDDERSSDSGFRDKGSLSESVEDACEGKYNLEDIEAELEEAFVKGAFNTDEDGGPKNGVHFEYEESKFYEEENKNYEDLSDVDGEIEFWQPNDKEYYAEMSEFSPGSAEGWYLHPPEDKSAEEQSDEVDDEFVRALRNELREKLPMQNRSFEREDEEDDSSVAKLNVNIMYAHSSPLTPILEENSEPHPKSPNSSLKSRRKNAVGLMESVKNIDNETFMQYLDFMVEHEGKDEDGQIEDIQMAAEEEIIAPKIVITKDCINKTSFENDIKVALQYDDILESEQPNSIVYLEDLEVSTCKVVDETKPKDDVLLINTSTNEATMESPKRRSHMAFVGGNNTPDSISHDEISLSEDSSRGEASTDFNSSPDLLSDFFITPDKTPFQSPKTICKVTTVEEIAVNDEATEIVDALRESGVVGNADVIIQQQQQTTNLPQINQKSSNTAATEMFLRSERIHTEELLLESSKKLEKFEMSTSFMGDDDDVSQDKDGTTEESAATSEKMEGSYTPDWESDSGDEHSSSSGEFIWKDGGEESKVKVRQATAVDLESSLHENSASDAAGKSESAMDDDDDDVSSTDSASISDFVPSAWDRTAAPARSALRSQSKKDESAKRRVWFKKEKYHCIYEYPREPSDVEDVDTPASTPADYSQYADWDLQEDEGADEHDESLTDTDSDSKKVVKDKYDFYTLSPFDELGGTVGDDGEFFISSSTRPFQFFTGSQFTAFGSAGLWASSPTTDNLLDERDFVTPDSGVEDLISADTPGDSPPNTDLPFTDLNQTTVAPEDSAPKQPSPEAISNANKRPARESLTLDLPKSHNADLGLVLSGLKNKGHGVESN